MFGFTDIHTHILGGVDDGANNDGVMFSMLDMAYATGTRRICLTPHYNLRLFGNNGDAVDRAFSALRAYSTGRYPDMELFLGNELYYTQDSVEALVSGRCRRMNGRKYVLVDFDFSISMYELRAALNDLLNSGFIPVFAHAERYDCVDGQLPALRELQKSGIPIQVNSTSIVGAWGRKIERRAWRLLKGGYADIVASDTHDIDDRPPRLDIVSRLLTAKLGAVYTEMLICGNPDRILGISRAEK